MACPLATMNCAAFDKAPILARWRRGRVQAHQGHGTWRRARSSARACACRARCSGDGRCQSPLEQIDIALINIRSRSCCRAGRPWRLFRWLLAFAAACSLVSTCCGGSVGSNCLIKHHSGSIILWILPSCDTALEAPTAEMPACCEIFPDGVENDEREGCPALRAAAEIGSSADAYVCHLLGGRRGRMDPGDVA